MEETKETEGTNGETSKTTEAPKEHSGEQEPEWARNLQASISALSEKLTQSQSQESREGATNPSAPAPLVVETPPLPKTEQKAEPSRRKVAARRLSLRPRR